MFAGGRISLLPAGLIALLLSSPVLTVEPTTPADPFYHIAKLVKKEPELPICCLSLVQSGDDAGLGEEKEILSFEEWKVKMEREQLLRQNSEKKDGDVSTGNKGSKASESRRGHEAGPGSASADGHPPLEPPTPPPPHFRVPLIDRFNYASLDCSAHVHDTHRSARSPSSLLSSKKDRYMLSPCVTPDGGDKFVIVELCDDIRIDTVQLANFEFFSGVFKDFSVSVAKTRRDGWTPAGTYRAKNIRGIQSFHPPQSLRDFYRFIRIDFHSHYGNEYYCPISLLRVYGLTHLEQWKREVWEAEYQAKNEAAAAAVRLIDSVSADGGAAPSNTVQELKGSPEKENSRLVAKEPPKVDNLLSKETATASSMATEGAKSTRTSDPDYTPERTIVSSLLLGTTDGLNKVSPSGSGHDQRSIDSPSTIKDTNLSESSSPTSTASSVQPQSPLPSSSESPVPAESSSVNQSSGSSSSSVESSRKVEPTTTLASSTPMPTIVPHESRPVPAVASTGESIYRTIMTRLSALEANSTLHLRYVEEQTRSLRDALTRLEEDVGRLEGLSKAMTQSFQKIINEMDRQRRRLEREQGELQTRVDYLTDEVILEKRLGIAQLCLLLVVLVFMALTRGSRGEPFIPEVSSGRRSDALREWGRRQFSNFSSGEWTSSSKLRAESRTRESEDFVKSPIPIKKTDKVKFPIQESGYAGDQTPRGSTTNLLMPPSTRGRIPGEIRAPHPRQFVSHRPRTPTSAGFTFYAQATRSAGLLGGSTSREGLGGGGGSSRPRIRRASSHSTPVPVAQSQSMREGVSGSGPVSAKKWAKLAHLHEIRKKSPKGGGEGQLDVQKALGHIKRWINEDKGEDDEGKQTSSDSPLDLGNRGRHREPLSVSSLQNRPRAYQSEISPRIVDPDTESENWVDTDVEGSEVDEQHPK